MTFLELFRVGWPVFLFIFGGICGLGAWLIKLEVFIATARRELKATAKDIEKLEREVSQIQSTSQTQAVQLGRIQEQLTMFGRTLDRIYQKLGAD